MNAMDYLVEKKLVRFIGVSNFSTEQVKEAQKHSRNRIVANQLKYNLWEKTDIETIRYCQENNMMVVAYEPFGRGSLTDEKIRLLSDLSKKYDKTEAQIILNWLISKKNVVALFKAGSEKHLKENMDIFDFQLTGEDSGKIDALVNS